MKERCEAEFIKVGDNTLFGKVVHASTWQDITRLEFDNGNTMEFNSTSELTIWED